MEKKKESQKRRKEEGLENGKWIRCGFRSVQSVHKKKKRRKEEKRKKRKKKEKGARSYRIYVKLLFPFGSIGRASGNLDLCDKIHLRADFQSVALGCLDCRSGAQATGKVLDSDRATGSIFHLHRARNGIVLFADQFDDIAGIIG